MEKLFTPWVIGIKYPKQITLILCDTNTVILLIIVIKLTHSFCISKKNITWITNPKRSNVVRWKNFEIVGSESNSRDNNIFEKNIGGIAKL